ncbi:rod shape-determining protein MreD [Inhella gelatinilytica]|uniref:Rod shape-determining protein MreD n=1 Tax=Inhella gelatinilytica TaxID=2795030 RepID=A0A931ITH8_9BURK|nr:rod shape-determining protein MreD [Inhella gelatinilytica]MBH9551844.1 rod shape-determining protein MreD [Inhella gelatinilytica]
MIMPRGTGQLLLPAKPWFIALTLLMALLLDMLPVGPQPAAPSALAVVLVFWNVHQARRIGVGWAFFLGLLMDVHHGAILGQHALAYSGLAFLAVTLHRRLLWFGVWQQALQVLPLFVAAHVVQVSVRLMAGGMSPSPWMLLAPVFEALLWPLAWVLLLAPQRRAPERDEHRPL